MILGAWLLSCGTLTLFVFWPGLWGLEEWLKFLKIVLFGACFALIDEVLRGIVGFFSLFSISFVLVMN